ncbi:MAG TPA: TRAP transporter substrate-binding protein [Candidatus Limiplasma sp.]|nr:TRAP transporter substrate-binding protein [Candidatus Limiplasma sp.]
MKMKKYLAILVALTMTFGLVSALAEGDPYADLGTYEMVIGHAQPETNPRDISLQKFKADVEEQTNGHVTVTIYNNGQLGNEKEMLEQVMYGTIQGMRGGHFDFSPCLVIFTAPFLTQNREEIEALLHSDLSDEICAEAGELTNCVILNVCDAAGYRQFSNNVHPITCPDDLVGLKMRVAPSITTIAWTFEALGASTVSIAYADLYMSLKTGVADGQENPWLNITSMKFYEVQKYFTEVNYQFHPDPFFVNVDWWNELPEEFQTILQACATDMGIYNDELVDENQNAALQTIIDYGCEVYVPTSEELQLFVDACQPVYQQMIDEGICTQEQMDRMFEIIEEVRAGE